MFALQASSKTCVSSEIHQQSVRHLSVIIIAYRRNMPKHQLSFQGRYTTLMPVSCRVMLRNYCLSLLLLKYTIKKCGTLDCIQCPCSTRCP